jgi:hypothetical protein
MKNSAFNRGFRLLFAAALLLQSRPLFAQGGQYIGWSQQMKWLRVNSLHAYFSEHGCEPETGGDNQYNNRFSWPAQYGLIQATLRARGMWLGCKDYYEAPIGKEFAFAVTNIGMKPNEYPAGRPIPNAVDFRLIGRFDHPVVSVDGKSATHNTLYDLLDEIDPDLKADRVLIVKNNTPIGVTVTKKVYAYTQQYNDNYFIYEYTLKNTGIIDAAGTVYQQPVKGFYFMLLSRIALAGESVPENSTDRTWGAGNSNYGRNVVDDVIGMNPEAPEFNDPTSPLFQLRANISWYGPHSERPVALEDDWGCPDEQGTGIMAAAKYVGQAVLHADAAPGDPSDDFTQPGTTYFLNSDEDIAQRTTSQSIYDETFMAKRYAFMIKGHAEKSRARQIEESGLAANEWGTGVGGYSNTQGFGPYDLQDGDSIRIVLVQGVAGLSREKNREVGGNWLQYYKGTGAPALVMPDGSTTTDHTAYKRAWVWTCKDSLLQTFRRARANYESGYSIPQPPEPPSRFTVESGGDRIRLTWADNAETDPHFGGYVVIRAQGTVSDPKAVYEKVFECGASDAVNAWDDTSAVRGFDYFYAVQSKDDGTQNIVDPGRPLVSGLFWTLTTLPANLRRAAGLDLEAVRVVPNPFDIRSRTLQFGDDSQIDQIAFYGLPPRCKVSVYTERGDRVWSKDHTNGAGDETWDSITSSRQIVVSGIYLLYVEVTEDGAGFKKGDSVIRKFVVIR